MIIKVVTMVMMVVIVVVMVVMVMINIIAILTIPHTSYLSRWVCFSNISTVTNAILEFRKWREIWGKDLNKVTQFSGGQAGV